MMILRRAIYAILFVFCMLNAPGYAAEAVGNEFDKVCEYFQQLEQLPKIDTMTSLQRNSFVMERISQNLRPESDARVAWEAIANADAAQRYELFKSSAESVHSGSWQCPSMKKLAIKTGAY